MADHYCAEHETVFFKKGGMKGFAHPIVDGNGKDTGKWCNEPKVKIEGELPPSTSPKVEEPATKVLPSGRNKAFALSYAKDICCAMITQGKEMSPAKTIDIARIFEQYLNGEQPKS